MHDPIEPHATFIIRVTSDADGRLAGTVERVRTSERRQFRGAESLGLLIERMAKEALKERPA